MDNNNFVNENDIRERSKPSSFWDKVKAFFNKLFSKNEKGVNKGTKQKKKMSKTGKIVLWSVLGAIVVALVLVYFLVIHPILFNQGKAFETIGDTQLTPSEQQTKPLDGEGEEEIDPYANVLSQADLEMMKDTVNVLIIGADYAPERETWNGKHAYHADVMMVLAVNFEENTVDMISIPRDTYAPIPGVDGIYKINASLDCGGGIPDGFPKVCETAERMLGGIPVDYYFAVTMPAVKELVNAMGGVTYDVEMDFQMAGREYKAGVQFMDGQGVLDYLRVRKGIKAAGDQNRINRQKKMLIALFKEMQNEDTILKIPDIWAAVKEGTYTNMNTSQIMSLAAFAYKLDADNIAMHSMGGAGRNIFNWNFVLTDQTKRVNIVKEVYGIDIERDEKYSKEGAVQRWAQMKTEKDLEVAEKFLGQLKSAFEADALITPKPSVTPTLPPTVAPPTKAPATTAPATQAPTQQPTQEPTLEPTQEPTPEPTMESNGEAPEPPVGEGKPTATVPVLTVTRPANAISKIEGRKYTDMQHYYYKAALELVNILKNSKTDTLEANEGILLACTELESICDSLAVSLGQKPLNWKIDYETTTNQIFVDFR